MYTKRIAQVVAVTVFAGIALAGCGGQTTTVTHTHPSGNSTYAGNLVVTDWQEPDGCGPASGGTFIDTVMCNPMLAVNGLYNIDNHANYFPDLGANLPTLRNGGAKIVNGNIVVTLKLKPGQRWSDGTPITMQDYKFSVDLNMAIGYTFGIDQIKSLVVKDPLTAIMTMKGKYVSFVANAYPTYVVPKHYIEKKFKSTNLATIATAFGNDLYNSPKDVVSGPYMVKSWASDDSRVILVPNPYYHTQPHTHPRYASITYVNLASTAQGLATALQAPKTHVDLAQDFQYDNLPALSQSGLHLNVLPSMQFEHLELNGRAGHPLHDVRVRQALMYGLDKVGLFRAAFRNVKGNVDQYLLHSVIPSASPWADTSLPLNDYDVTKAKALLAAAGYSTSSNLNDGAKHLTVRFYTTDTPVRRAIGAALSAYWGAIGVNVVQKYVDATGPGGLVAPWSSNGVLKRGTFDVADFSYAIPPDPTAYEQNFDPTLIPNAQNQAAATNYSGAGPEQFALLRKARYDTSTAQRHADLDAWQKMVHDQAYWIPLYNRANITVTDGSIGNFKPNPTSAGNAWNAYELYAQ